MSLFSCAVLNNGFFQIYADPTPVLLPGKSHGWRSLWATVHGVAKSQIKLGDFTFTFHFHALKTEMVTHSSVLAWRVPGIGEPDELPSMGSHKVGHDLSELAATAADTCPQAPILMSTSISHPSLPLVLLTSKQVYYKV